MKTAFSLSVFLFLVACGSREAMAIKEEHFGNAPLSEANYREWPGIVPLVNHPNRVYQVWVNGNEWLHYRGNTAALNDALRKFAASDAAVHEVLLRPGPYVVHPDRDKVISYDWNLHLVGKGIEDLPTRERGNNIWSKFPTMTVCVGGDIDLRKIDIPKGVSLVDLADLGRRYREALGSKDVLVRGWGARELADLDRYDAENLAAVIKLLKDEDQWVRRNAVGALGVFGKKAKSVVPTLREMRSTQDKHLKDQIEKTIEEIEQARDTTPAEEEHRTLLKKIREFRDSRKQ